MSHLRIQIDLAIPMPLNKNAEKLLSDTEKSIKKLQKIAEKINLGLPEEENTVRAQKHICNHEEGLPCEHWEDIV